MAELPEVPQLPEGLAEYPEVAELPQELTKYPEAAQLPGLPEVLEQRQRGSCIRWFTAMCQRCRESAS